MLFVFLFLNFLASADNSFSLDFFFSCSVFFDLPPSCSVLVSTEAWVTDLSPSYSESSHHSVLSPQEGGFLWGDAGDAMTKLRLLTTR